MNIGGRDHKNDDDEVDETETLVTPTTQKNAQSATKKVEDKDEIVHNLQNQLHEIKNKLKERDEEMEAAKKALKERDERIKELERQLEQQSSVCPKPQPKQQSAQSTTLFNENSQKSPPPKKVNNKQSSNKKTPGPGTGIRKRKRNEDANTSDVPDAIPVLPETKQEVKPIQPKQRFHLAEKIFREVKEPIWYRIIPIAEGEVNDICVATRHPWQLLLTMMYSEGLIKKKEFLNGKVQVEILHSGWREFATYLKKHGIRLQISRVNSKNDDTGLTSYWFCIGNEPKFDRPQKQFTAVEKGEYDYEAAYSVDNVNWKLRDALVQFKNSSGIQIPHDFPALPSKRQRHLKETFDLAERVFRQVKQPIWYRIVPVKLGEKNDICAATHHPWELLQPMLCSVGLIRIEESDGQTQTNIVRGNWKTFIEHMKHRGVTFEFWRVNKGRLKGDNTTGSPSYWFCIGDNPRFENPQKQFNAVKNKKFEYSITEDKMDLQIISELRNEMVKVAGGQQQLPRLKRLIREHDEWYWSMAIKRPCTGGGLDDKDHNGKDDTKKDKRVIYKNFVNPMEGEIAAALELDLEKRPRIQRNGNKEIEIHKARICNGDQRGLVLNMAKIWGWSDLRNSRKQRIRIAKAVCRRLAYDWGFEKDIAYSTLDMWEKKLQQAFDEGTDNPLELKYKGSRSTVDMIEDKHPGYVKELYLRARENLGPKATFKELGSEMNSLSRLPGEERPSLDLGRSTVWRWYRRHVGK